MRSKWFFNVAVFSFVGLLPNERWIVAEGRSIRCLRFGWCESFFFSIQWCDFLHWKFVFGFTLTRVESTRLGTIAYIFLQVDGRGVVKATLTFAGGKDKYRNFFPSFNALPPQQKILLCHAWCVFGLVAFCYYTNASCYSSCFCRSLFLSIWLDSIFFLLSAILVIVCYINVVPLLSDGTFFPSSFIRTLGKQNFTQSKSCATHLYISIAVVLFFPLLLLFLLGCCYFSVERGSFNIMFKKKGYM